MEVFIQNICPTASPYGVKRTIADVLHGPAFQQYQALPINFELFMFPPKADQCRRAVLTLPTYDIGQHFLRDYGGSQPYFSIQVGLTQLQVKPSRNSPRDNIVEKIRTFPYIDPEQHEQKKKLLEELRARTVSVGAIQFGWECRDNVFSVEYEKSCSGKGTLLFEGGKREFRVRVDEGDHSAIIVIRASQIAWAAMDRKSATETIFFLSLLYFPTYECIVAQEHEPEHSVSGHRAPLRQRLAAFNSDHAQYAMYVSLAVRIVCSDQNAVENLVELCKFAHVKRNKLLYPIVRRDLFSLAVQRDYRAWLSTLEWELAFQVDVLARDNTMDLHEILSLAPHLGRMARDKDTVYLSSFVRHFAREARDPKWYRDTTNPREALKELFKRCRRDFVPPGAQPADDIASGRRQEFDCLHAIVTPTTVRLEGPFPERGNRVVRKYAEHANSFLRVRFVDEARLQFRPDRDVDSRAFIHDRFGNVLRNGLVIAGRHFQFLAYSQSGLKEHSVWFAKSFKRTFTAPDGKFCEEDVTVDSIIAGLGIFDNVPHDPQLMFCPARYGARLAQSFSATEASVFIQPDMEAYIPDIKAADGRDFTDGVGTMSSDLAKATWVALCEGKRDPGSVVPSAVQFRYKGMKGVLSIDHTLPGKMLCYRPSMFKFAAPESNTLEIAKAFHKPGRFYLNRPLIMLLEELDIAGGYDFIKILQDAVVQKTEAAIRSLKDAATMFDHFGLGSAFGLSFIFSGLAKLGIENLNDIFSQQVVNFAVHHILRDIKYKARIPVPGGYNLVGVADVHGFLKEGEIFACIIPAEGQDPIYLQGATMISRSPVIHRGDVQVVRAIGPPPSDSPFAVEPLANTVVFSCKGLRPLPSCLGGGDLDGDEYVCTDIAALLPRIVYEPADYDSGKRKTLDHPSTRLDVADFVTESFHSDTVGLIATNWLTMLDQSPRGVLDPASGHENTRPLEILAELHSNAVDYAKTGLPISIREIPRSRLDAKPDWSAPELGGGDTVEYYESQRWIGQLYREIELSVPVVKRCHVQALKQRGFPSLDQVLDIFAKNKFPREDPVEKAIREHVTPFMVSPYRYSRKRIEPAWSCFKSYVSALRTICVTYSLVQRGSAMLTEEEAVVGTIVAPSSQPRARKENISGMHEQTSLLVSAVTSQIVGPDEKNEEETLKRAWVAFRISTIQPEAFGSRSFGYVAAREILRAVEALEKSRLAEGRERRNSSEGESGNLA